MSKIKPVTASVVKGSVDDRYVGVYNLKFNQCIILYTFYRFFYTQCKGAMCAFFLYVNNYNWYFG